MKRLTVKRDGRYVVADTTKLHNSVHGYYGPVVDVMARLEDLVAQTERELEFIQARMKEYRALERERSQQYRGLAERRDYCVRVLEEIKEKVLANVYSRYAV